MQAREAWAAKKVDCVSGRRVRVHNHHAVQPMVYNTWRHTEKLTASLCCWPISPLAPGYGLDAGSGGSTPQHTSPERVHDHSSMATEQAEGQSRVEV